MKRPIVIEARRLTRINGLDAEIAEWCGGHQTNEGCVIETLEGTMMACYGDWIICGVNGEFYPCKPDIFEATYDPVAD